MNKIGLLFGAESAFSLDIMNYINEMGVPDIIAEEVKVGITTINRPVEYKVIFDRFSSVVPFYSSALKYWEACGTKVINNPFWKCADDDFLHHAIALRFGIRTPRTALIPSKQVPKGFAPDDMRNLEYPLNWDEMFEYVGFPAFLKPNSSVGIINEYKVYNKHEFFSAYDLTGESTMILQQCIDWDAYYRVYTIGDNEIIIMNYNPTKPIHMRYSPEEPKIDSELYQEIKETALKISNGLGFEFNTVEFALKHNVPYVTEFNAYNTMIEKSILCEENYYKLLKSVSAFLVETAKKQTNTHRIYSWSKFMKS